MILVEGVEIEMIVAVGPVGQHDRAVVDPDVVVVVEKLVVAQLEHRCDWPVSASAR